jgi:UDP-N-acetyl-D-glucosamine dehydrogenase
VNDLRESPAFEIINELKENGAQVFYHDPFASKIKLDNTEMRTLSLSQKNLKEMDCVVIVTDHSTIDYNLVLKYAPLILDTRNALRRISHKKVIRL